MLNGVKIRFDTEFVRFEQTSEMVRTVVRDRVQNAEYTVASKYLIGADGANSKVVSQLGLPLDINSPGPVALNIVFELDLSKYMDSRNGNLHWVRPIKGFILNCYRCCMSMK
jgi:2,4-dichlorophenol 6-monooxygenase